MFGFVVVDDGVVADIGNRFVVFVDGRILGVDIGQVGAVVLVDVAVPRVVVNCDFIVVIYVRGGGDTFYNDRVEIGGVRSVSFRRIEINRIIT